MASPPSWTVVVFEPTKEEEYESVQAVPSKWIEGDQCFWPALPVEKLNIAIKKCHFNTCWPRHKVRTLRNSTFDNYALARKKAKKAELTSDLGTDDEEFITKKRIIKPLHYLSDSDSDDVVTPKPKKLFKLPLPPKIQKTVNIYENSDVTQTTSNIHQYDVEQASTEENEGPSFTPTSTRHSMIDDDLISNAKNSQNRIHCDCKKDIYVIKNLLVDVNAKLDILLQGSRGEPSEREGDILSKLEVSFPIKTENDLRKLEEFLSEKSNFSSVVNYLSKFGGVNLTEFLRRCLAPTLSDDIALLYSFKGRKQKEQFETLNLCRALIEAAEMSKLAGSKKEIELAIGAWLRRAQERKRREGLKQQFRM